MPPQLRTMPASNPGPGPAGATPKLSQLLQRARAAGATQQDLDELMDGDDPRAAVVALLERIQDSAPLPPLFDATVVGEAPLPMEGWLEPFAVEGMAAFPQVLSARSAGQAPL